MGAADLGGEAVKQLIQQASAKLRSELGNAAQRVTRAQAMAAMERSAANRGSLSGVAWIASTVFDRADGWAWERMKRLGEDPVAAFTLHQKLMEKDLAENALLLDPERLAALEGIARAQGRGEAVTAALQGLTAEELLLDLSDMPLASAPPRFSYEDAASRPAAAARPGPARPGRSHARTAHRIQGQAVKPSAPKPPRAALQRHAPSRGVASRRPSRPAPPPRGDEGWRQRLGTA
ncbi:hypothetical protein, partial [uncultured Azohydromonas sp.]|uniref:hypothetical protein n=1 Tax=uncultured Azohydromonas sp. TaxID=487342 RepID=UPI00263922A3